MGQDLIGRTFGRYRVDAKIGQGGMGIVFEATDETLKRVVALKVLGDGIVSDAARKARFMREARLAAALTHANIATVHDVGETEDGHVFIAMELVRGATLRQRLAGGPLGTSAALRIARDVARALVKAHALGIVHRDLKPDNIMVSEELDVKILDFGLAKPIDLEGANDPPSSRDAVGAVSASATLDGHIVGTPGYMSPEQAAGRPVDVRTDFFALGVLLYEMTTGVRPFTGASVAEILCATTHDEPARPSAITASVSRDLERLILRCLEKNADARFADAPELLAALDLLRDARDRDSPIASPAASTTSATDVGALKTQESFVGTTAPERRRVPRLLLLAIAASSIAASAAAVYVVRDRARAKWAGTTSAPSQSATPVTDLPPPPSRNPDLLAEYAAGMQALRDDDWGIAESHFEHVVSLDPLLALGHLRLAMVGEGTLDESIRRDHFARTIPLRSQLSPRDRAMMEALEPVLQRLHEDRIEAAERLRAMSLLYPGDVEIQDWLGILEQTNVRGLAAAEHAIALDPHDGQALQTRGDVLSTLGRSADARISFERCGAVSPGSAECFLGLMWLDSMEGRCDDAERDARRAVDRDPHLVGNLACVMFGAGRPLEAVREVVDQEASSSPGSWQAIMDQTRLALVTGDFVKARALAEKYEALADANPRSPFRDHLFPALVLTAIAGEIGDDDDVLRRAWSFVSRSDTWSKSSQTDSGMDPALWLARRTLRPGGLSREGFALRRAAWIDGQRRALAHPGLVWTYAYASTAETPEEAREALAILPEFAPLSSFVYHVGIPDAEVGSVYLLAGEVDLAITHLTKALATCGAFRHPFVHTRAALQLGEALESKGDSPGACAAYAKVLTRWGSAKPRSISADKARARRSALGCPP